MNGRVPSLGELERAVMDVVWAATAPLSVRNVLDRLDGRQPAYTTVMTVLDRLAGKGAVRRERVGRAWQYTAAQSRDQFIAELMLGALDLAGNRDGAASGRRDGALVHFAQSVSPREAETLRDALDRTDR